MTVNARTITDEEFFYGHKACPGCGGALAVRQALKVLGPHAVAALPAGCMSATGFNFPQLAFGNNAMITPFAATAAVLSGIEAGADKTDAVNVAASGAVMKTETSDVITQGTTNLFMTAAERTKLGKLVEGGEANQNAFSTVKVGSVTIAADTTTDTLELAAGSGITLTADAAGDKVTVAETYIDSCVVTSIDKVPANLRNGGLVIVKA